MRTKIKKNTQMIIVLLYIAIGMNFVFQMSKVDIQYALEYIVVLVSFFFMTGIWILCICRFGFYLFEPITMVVVLTILTFSIEPK